MYFNARFHRNKSFKELCKIPRGYKTTSPVEGPSKKTGQRTAAKENEASFPNITLPPVQSQQRAKWSETNNMWASATGPIPYHRTAQRQEDSMHREYSVPIVTTPSNDKCKGSFCPTSTSREMPYLTRARQDCLSCNFTKDVWHLSGEAPTSNSKYTSPLTAIHCTPSRLLLSSQISKSDSCDWGCSPPVGPTTRRDILGASTPIDEHLEETISATHNSDDFCNFKVVPRNSAYEDDGKDIPVLVNFHGSGADISPLLTKFQCFSSRP